VEVEWNWWIHSSLVFTLMEILSLILSDTHVLCSRFSDFQGVCLFVIILPYKLLIL
jgi:hypothetical protein